MSIPVFRDATGATGSSGPDQAPQSMTKSAFESLGIVMENGKPRFKLNEPAFLPGDISMRNNYDRDDDDETSFVVLGQSSMDFINAVSLADYEQIQKESLAVDYTSIVSALSHEEVEKKVIELLQENKKLKDTLSQNNSTMKNHFMTLSTYQQELSKVHNNHKKKFAETREEIIRLRKENEQLRIKVAMEDAMISSRFSGEMIRESMLQKHPTLVAHSLQEPMKPAESPAASITPQSSLKSESMNSVTQDVSSIADPSSKLMVEKNQLARQLHYQEEIIYSLKEQIRALTENSCVPLQFNLGTEVNDEENHKKFLENFTHYSDKLSTVAKCYAVQTNRFTTIQDCLKRCIDTLDYYEHIEPSDLSIDTRIMHKKIIDECRHQLIEEQLMNIKGKQSLIKAQNHFSVIFSDYNSALHELEILREENSKPVERKPSMDMGKLDVLREKKQLDEAKASFEAEKKAFEVEKESLSGEKASLNSQSLLYEAQMKSLKDAAKVYEKRHDEMLAELTKFKEDIRNKDIELEGIRARLALAKEDKDENELLKMQVTLFESDYKEEKEARQKLINEREHLTDTLGKLRDYNQRLLVKINGPNPATSVGGRHHQEMSPDGIPIDAFCNTCGLYKMPGQWHGLGYCQPVD